MYRLFTWKRTAGNEIRQAEKTAACAGQKQFQWATELETSQAHGAGEQQLLDTIPSFCATFGTT